MDEKTLALAVKKGIEAAEAQKKTGLTEKEQQEIDTLQKLSGLDPRQWQEAIDAVPVFNNPNQN